MRYALIKPLRKRFTREMARALPQFRERKVRSGVRGTTLYEWRASATLSCYVALVVDEATDRFTVELAWSRSRHFPAHVRQDLPGDPPRSGAVRFHLRALWQRYRVEPSWTLGERTPAEQQLEAALIDPVVSDDAKMALLEARLRRIEGAGSDVERQAQLVVDEPVNEALARIGPAVADVIARLRRYAVPYFAEVVAAEAASEAAAQARSEAVEAV
jgi:hypothetical protein